MPTQWLRFGVSFSPPYRFEGRGSASLNGALGERYFSGPAGLLAGYDPIHVVGNDSEVEVSTGLPGQLRFGLGFERIVQFMTGMSNIRDVIPFPRTPGNAKF